MAETENSSGRHVCQVCGANSDEKVLLVAEDKGQVTYACVRCLPILIHGGH